MNFQFCLIVFVMYSFQISHSTQNPRIIIVGAGASGIAAASRLIDNGFDNIVILEAEDRIGGRIYTTDFGESVVDLGAQFVIENGIVYNLVRDLDLLVNGVQKNEVYHSKEGLFTDNFLNMLYDWIRTLHHGVTDISWHDHILEKFNKTITDHFESDSDKSLIKNSIDFIKKTFLLLSGANSLNEVAGGSGEYVPDFKLVWRTGYKSFLDFLIKRLLGPKKESIFSLKTEVTKIEWGEEIDGVRLTSSDGPTYTADHVIVTLSLGVLKKQQKRLFSPPLPDQKQTTIDALGFCSILKLAFYFPEKWWNDSNIMLAWSENDLDSVDFTQGPSKNGQSWVTNITGFFLVHNNPNVLMAWYMGELILEVELCSNDVLLNGAYYVLQRFLGKSFKNITKPTKVLFNNWSNNPHFRGVMSYETVESKKNSVNGENLAEPILANGKLRILFAGEATNKFTYGSVNGAVSSGFREADRIIKHYN